MAANAWPFFVYALTDDDAIVYVGKGSGRRLRQQMSRSGCKGHELARFSCEDEAYAFERAMIAKHNPKRNRHPGGNGARVTPVPQPKWLREIGRVGTRVYAARLLLKHAHLVPASKLDAIRLVAYG
jgi:hypothetical protein